MNAKYRNKYLEFEDGYKIPYELNTNDAEVKVSIRPEEFVMTKHEDGMHGVVVDNIFLGLNTHYHVRLETGQLVEVIQVSSLENRIKVGTEVRLSIQTDKINIFDSKGSRNLLRDVE